MHNDSQATKQFPAVYDDIDYDSIISDRLNLSVTPFCMTIEKMLALQYTTEQRAAIDAELHEIASGKDTLYSYERTDKFMRVGGTSYVQVLSELCQLPFSSYGDSCTRIQNIPIIIDGQMIFRSLDGYFKGLLYLTQIERRYSSSESVEWKTTYNHEWTIHRAENIFEITDKYVALEKLNDYPWMFGHCSEMLRDDIDVIITALSAHPLSFVHSASSEDEYEYAVSLAAANFGYCSDRFKNLFNTDKEFVRTVIDRSDDVFQHCSYEFSIDPILIANRDMAKAQRDRMNYDHSNLSPEFRRAYDVAMTIHGKNSAEMRKTFADVARGTYINNFSMPTMATRNNSSSAEPPSK